MEELLALLENALAQQDRHRSDLVGLASSGHKRAEPGLRGLADTLQLPIAWLSAEQLANYQTRLSQHSELCRVVTGSAGVAEACAMAQAEVLGHGAHADLLGSKIRSANATCALAVFPLAIGV